MSLPAANRDVWDRAVHLPHYVDRQQASEVLRRLTDAGRRQFDHEIREAEAVGPARVNAVVYSWYRTAEHVDDPSFLDRLARARETIGTAPPWTAEGIAELHRLAEMDQ